jgi:hypothetical protein
MTHETDVELIWKVLLWEGGLDFNYSARSKPTVSCLGAFHTDLELTVVS